MTNPPNGANDARSEKSAPANRAYDAGDAKTSPSNRTNDVRGEQTSPSNRKNGARDERNAAAKRPNDADGEITAPAPPATDAGDVKTGVNPERSCDAKSARSFDANGAAERDATAASSSAESASTRRDSLSAASSPSSAAPTAESSPRAGEGEDTFSLRACAWPRRRKEQGPVRMIAPEEVPGWIVYEDARLLVVNKPGDVVCHPSKAGPWSSLVGALREYAALPTVHLVFRLDRETSGVVVLAKDAKMASRLQVAMQQRKIGKTYLAILTGELRAPVTLDAPLGDDITSPVFVKSAVVPIGEGQPAVTHFTPLASAGGVTLVRVVTETGRKHQIRAHAQALGHSLVGDKIYGPDARLYLDFIDHGWTDALAAKLFLPRQALHCAAIDLQPAGLPYVFEAPLPADLRTFLAERGITWPCPAG